MQLHELISLAAFPRPTLPSSKSQGAYTYNNQCKDVG